MTRTQCFALGMVLAVMGVAALFQIIPVDHVMRLVSIGALGTVAIVASMVFFLCAFRTRYSLDELDIWRSAQQLITAHGEMAEWEAAMRADAALNDGNMDGVRVWRAVLEAVKKLQNNERPKDQPLN